MSDEEKDREEVRLRREARELASGDVRARKARLMRANEISRRKARRAHQQ